MDTLFDFLDIVDAIATTGWSITPGFVPDAEIHRLLEAELALWREGAFRAAGIGAGAAVERPEIRSDRIHWLDPLALPEAVVPYWERLAALRQELNRTLYLGLRGFEGHFAVYPAGAFYKRHLDQFKTAPHRTVSCILYLNQGWTPEDGGLLRIYPSDAPDDAGIDVVPRAGTFVCFLSDRVPHEVLPARRERFSLTGWMDRK
ncbi:MAG: 2OG-Fe(II) oxygenase [Rhodothermales bacterium]|nr:2OG-Fe(II) oxygenase [Rhodothermales bacterium]